MNRIVLFILIGISLLSVAKASSKSMAVPRFVTIKFNEVNARTGPAVDCPIEWVFIKKGEPVEVIAEYGKWRQIKDINDEGGWVHSSVLSGKRSVVIIAEDLMPLLDSPGQYDRIVAKLSPNLRCIFYKCAEDWCQVNCQSYRGWIARKFLWGVYPDE